MRTYVLKPHDRMPLYEQLYRALKEDILTGVIRGGEKLPSKRALAEHLNISRSYLYRIFKQELGISPQRAILNFRLEKAALLMENSRANLTEIALSCGFCDLAHFSKAYKDKYNVRPKAEKRRGT